MNKDIKQNLILIFLFLLLLSLAGYIVYDSYSKKLSLQQKIRQLEETRKQIEEIDKQLERLKNFNEEEYAEKLTNLMNFDNYLSTSTDIQLEGVEIIHNYTTNTKLVINHKEGYQIEIENDLILNRSWNTEDLTFDSLTAIETTGPDAPPKYWAQMYIWVTKKRESFGDNHLYQEKFNLIQDPKNPKIMINGVEFTKVFQEGPSPDYEHAVYSYLTLKNDKIYEIYITSISLYEKYVKTFRFLEE